VQTYVALLRGINVAGRRTVGMADLRDLFARLGHVDVQTYVQSGNVLLRSDEDPADIVAAVEHGIAGHLGLDVKVVLRSAAELRGIVEHNPFLVDGADPKALYATLLAGPPDRTRVREVNALDYAPEQQHVEGTTVYLHLPNGYGRTKLNIAFFERRLGVAATTRNWKTVTTLLDLSGG